MAFAGITATEAMIDQKTGANVSASFTGDMKAVSLLMAEGWLNSETRYNWSDAFVVPLNADVLSLISMVTSSLVAMDAINYDMSGYTNRAEAETMLDVLHNIVNKGVKTLSSKEVQTFMLAS